jgi:hypothetical protein
MRILALVGALAIAVAIGAAIFFFGGFYSVAATAAEPGIINWALVNVRVLSRWNGKETRERTNYSPRVFRSYAAGDS